MPHSLTSFKPRSGTSGVRLNLRRSGGWPKKKNNRSYKNIMTIYISLLFQESPFLLRQTFKQQTSQTFYNEHRYTYVRLASIPRTARGRTDIHMYTRARARAHTPTHTQRKSMMHRFDRNTNTVSLCIALWSYSIKHRH